MYAVIKTGGKQYRVSEGDVIYVEKLAAEVETEVEFTEVLAVGHDGQTTIGTPNVKGAVVTGKVLKQGKAKKVTVFFYRPKKDSKRKLGHRQPYSKVEIVSIKG